MKKPARVVNTSSVEVLSSRNDLALSMFLKVDRTSQVQVKIAFHLSKDDTNMYSLIMVFIRMFVLRDA